MSFCFPVRLASFLSGLSLCSLFLPAAFREGARLWRVLRRCVVGLQQRDPLFCPLPSPSFVSFGRAVRGEPKRRDEGGWVEGRAWPGCLGKGVLSRAGGQAGRDEGGKVLLLPARAGGDCGAALLGDGVFKLESADEATDSPLAERRVLKRSDKGGYMYYHIENSALRCMESLEPKTPSWTENDLLVLITEYWKRKDILRAKASESVTNLQKRECWIEITDVVNARCFTPHTKKTMDQLKRKWEKTIMLAKKAALNIQKRSGNLSDLAPAYQLALSIVCEDFPASLECANGLAAADVPSLAEPPNAGGYIDEVSSMVITELEEESSGDGPPIAKCDKTQPVKAEMLSEAAECAPHSLGSRAFQPVLSGSSTQDGATDGIHQPHQDATADFVSNFRKRKWEQDLVELQKEKVRRQIQYHKVQHELQMSVLRSQMEFWEMKKSKLAAEIRQGGIPTLPPTLPTADAS